jgi:hypothetical protein
MKKGAFSESDDHPFFENFIIITRRECSDKYLFVNQHNIKKNQLKTRLFFVLGI